MINKIFFYFTLFIFLSGCSRPLLFKETRILMGTFAEVTCYSSDKTHALNTMDKAFDEIERIERLFSKYEETSAISMINRLAGKEEIKINRELFRLIERSIYYSKISEGSFDITVAPLVDIWDQAREGSSIPDSEVINEAQKFVGYRNIVLNEKKSTIHFLNKNTKIDLGGIAKGYAVDRAKEILLSHGIGDALINIGGNIFALGSPPGKEGWEIGIQHPRDKKDIIHRLNLKNKAVSTSGDYERFFILEGKRFSHMINPINGMPAEGIISVTVVADTAETADALSTAAFVMGVDNGLRLIESLGDTEVFIFDKDAKLIKYP